MHRSGDDFCWCYCCCCVIIFVVVVAVSIVVVVVVVVERWNVWGDDWLFDLRSGFLSHSFENFVAPRNELGNVSCGFPVFWGIEAKKILEKWKEWHDD